MRGGFKKKKGRKGKREEKSLNPKPETWVGRLNLWYLLWIPVVQLRFAEPRFLSCKMKLIISISYIIYVKVFFQYTKC